MDADITRALEALASRQPAAQALHVSGRRSLTYADLGTQIRYVRHQLGECGVTRADVVVGVVPLRPEMAVACASVPAAATFAPLGPALSADGYAELLTRLRPKLAIVPAGADHPIRAAARRCGVAEIDLLADASAPAGMFTLELTRQQASLAHAASSRPEWAYVLTSSGTTGRAKLVPVSHLRLVSYAQALGDWLELSSTDIASHLVPLHTGQGLEAGLMIPLLRGGSVVCLPDSDIDPFFAALDEYRMTWVVAGPTVHRELLRRAPAFRESVARNSLRFIRVGADRLESAEIERIEQAFGVPLLTGFGLTEARMISHDPLPPRTRKRGAVGVAACNEVAIMSEAGEVCAAGEVGEIVVRGPLVFEGYFDDEQATSAAFVDGWFHTGDLGRFDEEGYLYLAGRMNELINRGGEKISPAAFDAVLQAIPGVRAAATFAIAHPSLRQELAAAVVRDGNALEASHIIAELQQRMGPARVPRHIYFVDALPRTDSGKVRRSELSRRLSPGQTPASSSGAPPARTAAHTLSPLEAALTGLWSSVLEVGPIGKNDDFFLLGGDSLRVTRLLTAVKTVFAVDLPIESMFLSAGTVAGMAGMIEDARARGGAVGQADDAQGQSTTT